MARPTTVLTSVNAFLSTFELDEVSKTWAAMARIAAKQLDDSDEIRSTTPLVNTLDGLITQVREHHDPDVDTSDQFLLWLNRNTTQVTPMEVLTDLLGMNEVERLKVEQAAAFHAEQPEGIRWPGYAAGVCTPWPGYDELGLRDDLSEDARQGSGRV